MCHTESVHCQLARRGGGQGREKERERRKERKKRKRGKGREGKGREGKGREGKGREGKGRERKRKRKEKQTWGIFKPKEIIPQGSTVIKTRRKLTHQSINQYVINLHEYEMLKTTIMMITFRVFIELNTMHKSWVRGKQTKIL